MKHDHQPSHSETPAANQSNSTHPAAALRASSPPRTRRSKVQAPVSSTAAGPDAIALRAYQLFEARNGQHGFDVDDWLRAEAELTAPMPAPQKRRAARRSPQS
jgi:hypothetical protein